MSNYLLYFILISVLWIVVVLFFSTKKQILKNTKSNNFSSDFNIIASDSSMNNFPSNFTINIVEDIPINIEGLSHISFKISDLLNGNYIMPKKYRKDYDPLKDSDNDSTSKINNIVKEETIVLSDSQFDLDDLISIYIK